MPAFTHLCQKFNISLAHNTLTLYPKKTGEKGLAARMNQCFQIIGFEIVDVEYSIESLDPQAFDELGRPTFVHRDDSDHYLYHNDQFNRNDTHYHMKFPRALTENTLEKILSIFVTGDLISSAEKLSFLDAYKQANVINPEETKFLTALNAIRLKAEKMREKANKKPEKYATAATHAEQLYADLDKATTTYLNNKNATTYRIFQKTCSDVIEEHRSVLEAHRGWKNVLCNLGTAALGLDVFYLMAAGCNYYRTQGKNFFFLFNTDSINKTDDFQNAVAVAAPPPQ